MSESESKITVTSARKFNVASDNLYPKIAGNFVFFFKFLRSIRINTAKKTKAKGEGLGLLDY